MARCFSERAVVLENQQSSRGHATRRAGGGLVELKGVFKGVEEDMNAINDPADLWFPVDGFRNASGCGWSDDVVGDALDLHFRSGEAGEVARNVEFDAVGHEIMRLM